MAHTAENEGRRGAFHGEDEKPLSSIWRDTENRLEDPTYVSSDFLCEIDHQLRFAREHVCVGGAIGSLRKHKETRISNNEIHGHSVTNLPIRQHHLVRAVLRSLT